jgi:hypothetical protein
MSSQCEVKIRHSDYSALTSEVREMFEMYADGPVRRVGADLVAMMEKSRWSEIETEMKKTVVINLLGG